MTADKCRCERSVAIYFVLLHGEPSEAIQSDASAPVFVNTQLAVKG